MTLPGSGFFSFPDQWQPVLHERPPTAITGPSSNAGTYNYQPYQRRPRHPGLHPRRPTRTSRGVGYGSNPFIDIGAYQYVNLHPPEVTAVTATVTSTTSATGTATIPFYTVGGKAGSNTDAADDQRHLQRADRPLTLNGQHGPARGAGHRAGHDRSKFINLAGKLSYDSATNTLVINLGAAGLTLPTDAYRLILFGSGSPVIANTQGIALDGENLTNGDDPNSGTQLALPSGNGYPGGNFYDTFIINTTPPAIVKGSLQMSPASDTNIVGDDITSRPRRRSPARSPSPTRPSSRWPARRRSSTSASP